MESQIQLSYITTNHYPQQTYEPNTNTNPFLIDSPISSSSTSSPPINYINAKHYKHLINNEIPKLFTDDSSGLEPHDLTRLLEYDTRNTLLHLASSISHLDSMDFIIQRCPQLIRQQNSDFDLPLHVAVKTSQFKAVEKLVISGKNLNNEISMLEIVNKERNTALHIALENQDEYMAHFLFDKCPKVFYFLNKENISPLYLAIKAEFWDLVRKMLSQDNVDTYTEATPKLLEGVSVVHAAIIAKNIDILDLILVKYSGLATCKTDELKRSPISHAAYIGFLEGVSSIHDKFPNQAFKMDEDKTGSFPLHSACKGGNIKVVKALFSILPEKSWFLCNKKKQNILHVAAESGKIEIVEFILGHPNLESLINVKDEDGNTPLHLGAKEKHPRVVYVLTWDKRVKLGLQNNKRLTALDIVEDYEDQVPSFKERLTWLSLRYAGVPSAPQLHYKNIDIIDQPNMVNNSPNTEEIPTNDHTNIMVLNQLALSNLLKTHPKLKPKTKYKERVNTLLVVATLIATVTFTAAFTVPGGFNDTTPNKGLATLSHKFFFKVFVICDTISMYSAILSLVTLIWAQLDDPRLVLVSLDVALPLLGISLAMMVVAFTAAFYVVLHSKVFWLGVLVLVMGGVFLVVLVVFLIPFYSPTSSIRNKILRYVSHVPFMIMLLVCEKGLRGAR